MLNQQPFIQEVLMKNTYKIMKKLNPKPSCKPSNEQEHHLPNNNLPRSCASLQENRNQDKS